MIPLPNHSIQRMGASRSGQWQFEHLRRLAPAAAADRSPLPDVLDFCRERLLREFHAFGVVFTHGTGLLSKIVNHFQ
jgi:hypothetical protein